MTDMRQIQCVRLSINAKHFSARVTVSIKILYRFIHLKELVVLLRTSSNYEEKMPTEVLLSNCKFFKEIGLLDSGERRSIYQKVIMLVFISLELLISVPAIVYFVQNIHNIRKATESIYCFSAYR